MIINADGSYVYGQTNAGGGGDAGSIISRGGGEPTKGKWKTRNSFIYIMESGQSQWAPYARYTISASTMKFVYREGAPKIWKRN